MSAPARCPVHHGPADLCPFSSPLVGCEGGGPDHTRPATQLITYRIRSPHGDVESYAVLTCDFSGCIGNAEAHAHAVGERVERRPLTREDAEQVSGLDLGSAVTA